LELGDGNTVASRNVGAEDEWVLLSVAKTNEEPMETETDEENQISDASGTVDVTVGSPEREETNRKVGQRVSQNTRVLFGRKSPRSVTYAAARSEKKLDTNLKTRTLSRPLKGKKSQRRAPRKNIAKAASKNMHRSACGINNRRNC